MTQETLNTRFGHLRHWLNTQHVDQYWAAALLPFLAEAYKNNASAYTDQWLPYLESRGDLWSQFVFEVLYQNTITVYNRCTAERFEISRKELIKLAPFIKYREHLGDFIEPDEVFRLMAYSMGVDPGSVYTDFSDLIPSSFNGLHHATFITFSVEVEGDAHFGSEASYYTMCEEDVMTGLFKRVVSKSLPKLEQIEVGDEDHPDIDPTLLFDAIAKSPASFKSLRHIKLDGLDDLCADVLTSVIRHDALTHVRALSLPTSQVDPEHFERADFSSLEVLSFRSLNNAQALALSRNQTLHRLKVLLVDYPEALAADAHERLAHIAPIQTIQLGVESQSAIDSIRYWLSASARRQAKHAYFNCTGFRELTEDDENERIVMPPPPDLSRPAWTMMSPFIHFLSLSRDVLFELLQHPDLGVELDGVFVERLDAVQLAQLATLPWFKALSHFGVEQYGLREEGVDSLVGVLSRHPKPWKTLYLSTTTPLSARSFEVFLEHEVFHSIERLALHHQTPTQLIALAQTLPNLEYLELKALSLEDAQVIVAHLKHLKGLHLCQLAKIDEETRALLSTHAAIQEALRAGKSGEWCLYTVADRAGLDTTDTTSTA